MPEKKRCGPCEEALKVDLKEISCKELPPDKKKACEEEVENYFRRPNIDPAEFSKHMKGKGFF